jgi:hypothetical protein
MGSPIVRIKSLMRLQQETQIMNDSRKRIISQLIKSRAKAVRLTDVTRIAAIFGHNMRHDPEPQTPDLLCTVNVGQGSQALERHISCSNDHFLLQGSDS